MFIERKLNPTTNQIELWRCRWEYAAGGAARKVFLAKVADEQPLKPEGNSWSQAQAICWAYGRTLGNIAVFAPAVLGDFPAKSGDDALLPCDFVNAGKFRHGPDRWWCRTHQTYWGTKADQQSFEKSGLMRCANHEQAMNYVVDPLIVNVNEHASIGIWCSLPPAITSHPVPPRAPRIHVHVRQDADGPKTIDRDFAAISLIYSKDLELFHNDEITRVDVTPPAAFDFMRALEEEREMTCIACGKCGFPHLDLGDFARKAHRKHFCGNCGWDSTWSQGAIVSTPLKPLHDQMAKNLQFEKPNRTLNLDKYPGCTYMVWASTPAILWTADRPQESGIHVHVNDGAKRVVDDTFAEVVLEGIPLDRGALLTAMIEKTIT
jgi:hypothetical protein